MIEAMRRMMGPLESRIRLTLSRAIVSLIDDGTKAQSLQVELLADEAQDGVERFQDYGFTAHPHPGAEAIIACPAGLRSHAVAIVVEDRRYRLTGLQQGEVAIFDDLGNVVKLGRDALSIVAATKVTVNAPQVEVTADSVEVTADQVTVTSDAVDLGAAGGAKVARVGDSVDLGTGLIVSGSDKVKAA